VVTTQVAARYTDDDRDGRRERAPDRALAAGVAATSHTGSLVVSQLVRHASKRAPVGTCRSWNSPEDPRSKSVPPLGTVSVTWSGAGAVQVAGVLGGGWAGSEQDRRGQEQRESEASASSVWGC
jgi:hypothetical protein